MSGAETLGGIIFGPVWIGAGFASIWAFLFSGILLGAALIFTCVFAFILNLACASVTKREKAERAIEVRLRAHIAELEGEAFSLRAQIYQLESDISDIEKYGGC